MKMPQRFFCLLPHCVEHEQEQESTHHLLTVEYSPFLNEWAAKYIHHIGDHRKMGSLHPYLLLEKEKLTISKLR